MWGSIFLIQLPREKQLITFSNFAQKHKENATGGTYLANCVSISIQSFN